MTYRLPVHRTPAFPLGGISTLQKCRMYREVHHEITACVSDASFAFFSLFEDVYIEHEVTFVPNSDDDTINSVNLQLDDTSFMKTLYAL